MPFPVLSDEGWKKAQPFRHDLLNWGRKGGVVIPSNIGQAIGIGKEDRLSYGSGISTVRAWLRMLTEAHKKHQGKQF